MNPHAKWQYMFNKTNNSFRALSSCRVAFYNSHIYIAVLVHIYYITIHQWLLVTYKKNQPQTTSTTEKTWQAMKKEHSLTFIFSSSCFFFDNLLSHITFSCVPHLFSMLDLTIFIFIFLSCLCLFMCFISILVCTRFSFH